MKSEKPEWLMKKEMDDAEIETYGDRGWTRRKSHGAVYGPSESKVDQLGDGLIDVNQIMARYERMPTAEQLAAAGLVSGGFYENFIGSPDFETALQTAIKGKNAFALLPADEREYFQNNPAQWIDWVTDPANKEEAIRRGHRNPDVPKETEVTLKDINETLKRGASKPSKKTEEGSDAS